MSASRLASAKKLNIKSAKTREKPRQGASKINALRNNPGGVGSIRVDYTQADQEEEVNNILYTADPQGNLTGKDKQNAKNILKDFLGKQSQTGSVIEFQAMRLVKDPTRQEVRDWARVIIDPAQAAGLELFRRIVPSDRANAMSFKHTDRERIFLKCKFKLALVNQDPTPIGPNKPSWRDLYNGSSLKKGLEAVEPDLITYSWPPRAPRPILKIFELKVGDGENKAGEHEQLMRCVHLTRKYLIPRLGLTPEITPDVQMYFCAWKFGVKDPNSEPNFTIWSGFGGNVPPEWKVKLMAGPRAFAQEVGISADAIQALLLSMELRRQEALYTLLKKYRRWGRYGNMRERTWARIGRTFKNLGYNNPFRVAPVQGAGRAESVAATGSRKLASEAFGGRPPQRKAAGTAGLRFKNKKRLENKRVRSARETGNSLAQSLSRVAAQLPIGQAVTPRNLNSTASIILNQLYARGIPPEQISALAQSLVRVSSVPRPNRVAVAAARTPGVVAARAAFEAARAASASRAAPPSLGGMFD
jgi:hypothetical protein